MSAFPIINRQYYGSGPIGTTYGYQMMGAGVGMAVGALIGGQLRDFTGNFDATMALSLGLSLVGVISIMLLPTTKKELLPGLGRPTAGRFSAGACSRRRRLARPFPAFLLFALDFPFYYRASGYVLNSVIEARHARNDG